MGQVVYLYTRGAEVYRLCPGAEWASAQDRSSGRFDNATFRHWVRYCVADLSDPARELLLWLGGLCKPLRPLAAVDPRELPLKRRESLARYLRELEAEGLILRLGEVDHVRKRSAA